MVLDFTVMYPHKNVNVFVDSVDAMITERLIF